MPEMEDSRLHLELRREEPVVERRSRPVFARTEPPDYPRGLGAMLGDRLQTARQRADTDIGGYDERCLSCTMLWTPVPNRRSMTLRGDTLDRTELRNADIVFRATLETMSRGVVVARIGGKVKRKDFVRHEEQIMLKKKKLDDFRQELDQACEWLNIDRGRAREYVRLLKDFGRGEHGPEHLLAYYEADEIVQLFELWGNDIGRFPGLQARLKQACAKGPAMTEDEKTSNSSNKPRNDAFGYLMAGKFLKAGISVGTVDGIRAGLIGRYLSGPELWFQSKLQSPSFAVSFRMSTSRVARQIVHQSPQHRKKTSTRLRSKNTE